MINGRSTIPDFREMVKIRSYHLCARNARRELSVGDKNTEWKIFLTRKERLPLKLKERFAITRQTISKKFRTGAGWTCRVEQ